MWVRGEHPQVLTLKSKRFQFIQTHTFCVWYNQELAQFKVSDADINKRK